MIPLESSSFVKVLAVDARPVLLRGIVDVVDSLEPVLKVVETATCYDRALQIADQLRPGAVVLGCIDDPIAPAEAIAHFARHCGARVLLVTDARSGDTLSADGAFRAGAVAAVPLDAPVDRFLCTLLQAVRSPVACAAGAGAAAMADAGAAGEPGLDEPGVQPGPRIRTSNGDSAGRPAAALRLTRREMDVIQAIVAHPEAKYLAVGALLNVSEHTVHNHLTSIYQKLNVVNRTDLLHYALKNRLV